MQSNIGNPGHTGQGNSDATIAPAISDLRFRRSLDHRSGQSGCITCKNGWFIGRFRQDVAGQAERVLRSVRICPTTGEGRLNKSQRELRLKQIIAESGANDLQQARKVQAANCAVTFDMQAEEWLRSMQNRKRDPVKPRTISNCKSHLAWLLPHVGNVPLSDLTPARARRLITEMADAGLSAKTIKNYFAVFTQVIASAKDDQGAEKYPYKWDAAFLDLPRIERDHQRRPSFTAADIEQILSHASEPQEAVLYALLAGTGVRVGEALGLEVRHFVDDAVHIEQAIWNGKPFSPKTEAGRRIVDLSAELSAMLRQFIGQRQRGYIFRTENGKPLHQSNLLRRSLHPILRKLEIPKQGFHGFRRFRITHLRKQRVAEDLIRLWAGHSSGKTVTDGYVRLRDDEQFRKAAIEQAGIGFRLKTLLVVPHVPLVEGIENELQVTVN